jgi:hypothetical protein
VVHADNQKAITLQAKGNPSFSLVIPPSAGKIFSKSIFDKKIREQNFISFIF